MKHYQICFTRIGGQGSGDGWQTVNASPDLTSETISNYTRFQNGNVYPPSFDAEDSSKQVVSELQVDATSAFLTNIKFGLKDQTGRPSMFAHSFIFPLNEFAQHPQEVLGIEQDNFAFDVSQTASLSPTLAKKSPFSLIESVESLGLTKYSYTILIQCIYFILDGKAKSSLHIICDCTPDTIHKLMTCIYMSLPIEFRKKITYSTYELQNGAVKTIIFDRKVKNAGDYHIIPQSGENNVISDILLKRWEKYDFMRFVPNNYKENINLDQYFNRLEEKLSLFGSTQTTSLDLYKIAYDLISDEENQNTAVTSEFLCKRLNELLSAPINHPYIDQQIQYVLSDIIEYKVPLNDIISEKLCRKLDTTHDQDLIEYGYRYNSEKIGCMSVEDGAKYLFDVYNDRQSESFIQIKNLLDRDLNGQDILNHLYTKLIATRMTNNKENIIAFFEETKTLYDRSKIQSSLLEMVYSYFESLVIKNPNPVTLMMDVDDLLCSVLNDDPHETDKAKTFVKRLYWDNFNYAELNLESPHMYKDIILQANEKCQLATELLQTYQFFTKGDALQFDSQVSNLFSNKSTFFTHDERSLLVKKLQAVCVENRSLIDDTDIDIWISLAFLLRFEKKNPVQFLIENHIRPMSKFFNIAYPQSEILQDDKIKEIFINLLSKYAQEKTEYSKVATEALHIIKEYEKRAKQDIKRQQREKKREVKESSEKSSFFSKGGNIFKKKNNDDNDNKY